MEDVKLKFRGGMQFTADVNGHSIDIDGPEELGGANIGPRPKPLLLVALAGCSGMDVASLARKMRVEIVELNIDVQAQKSEDVMPVVYTAANIKYQFTADDADADKIVKMVTMSQERYCGVASMLQKAFKIDYEIYLNNKKIK